MAGFTLDGVGVINNKKSSGKKSDKDEFLCEGLYQIAALDQVLADVKAARDDLEVEVKALVQEEFVRLGCATKRQPANFIGCENGATASLELRKRSTRSTLKVEEITLCDEFKIEYEDVWDVIETFVINPEYLADKKVMGALEKAVGAAIAQGKLPLDILQKQTGVSRTILSEVALPNLFAKGKEIVEKAISFCSVLAVGKTKFPGTIDDAIKIAADLVPSLAKARAAKPAAAKRKAA